MMASLGGGDCARLVTTRGTAGPKPLQTRDASSKIQGVSGHKCRHTYSSTALQNSGICQIALQSLISLVDLVIGHYFCMGSE